MLTSELLSVIEQYVTGAIILEQLEDWLAPRWVLLFSLPPVEPEATDLAAAVELGLAEISNGSRSEEEFRSMVMTLLQQSRTIPLSYPGQGKMTGTESSNQESPTVVYAEFEAVPA